MGFKIENGNSSSHTSVSNCFIEEYMPSANGEFVKVYIYLLKCASGTEAGSSVCTIADALDVTEKDVIRAFKFWEKAGLLTLTFDENKMLTSLVIHECTSSGIIKDTSKKIINTANESTSDTSADEKSNTTAEVIRTETDNNKVPEKNPYKKKTYTKSDLAYFSSQDDIAQLLYIAEKYLAKTLTNTDTNTIIYVYDILKFPVELIEYLIEYCVSIGHKSIHYIEAVALSWADQDVSSVEEAKRINVIFNKFSTPILKSFGIIGRIAAPEEMNYIIKWTNTYGFKLEIILEACSKTINATHGANFKYADTILQNWKSKGVSTIDDIKKIDADFKASNTKKASGNSTPANSKKTNYNNYDQRTYDYTDLEKQLLNKQ